MTRAEQLIESAVSGQSADAGEVLTTWLIEVGLPLNEAIDNALRALRTLRSQMEVSAPKAGRLAGPERYMLQKLKDDASKVDACIATLLQMKRGYRA